MRHHVKNTGDRQQPHNFPGKIRSLPVGHVPLTLCGTTHFYALPLTGRVQHAVHKKYIEEDAAGNCAYSQQNLDHVGGGESPAGSTNNRPAVSHHCSCTSLAGKLMTVVTVGHRLATGQHTLTTRSKLHATCHFLYSGSALDECTG